MIGVPGIEPKVKPKDLHFEKTIDEKGTVKILGLSKESGKTMSTEEFPGAGKGQLPQIREANMPPEYDLIMGENFPGYMSDPEVRKQAALIYADPIKGAKLRKDVKDREQETAEMKRSNVYIGMDENGKPVIMSSKGAPNLRTVEPPGGKLLPKIIPEDVKTSYTAVGQAYDLIKGLKNLYDPLNIGGRLDASKVWMGAISGNNPNAKTYISAREAFLGNLSRSLAAEKGVLTQQDIERVAGALPKIGLNPATSDNKEEAEQKWNFIDTIMKSAERRMKEKIKMTYGDMPEIRRGESGTSIRDQAISELNKRRKAVDEESIKKAIKLLGGE